MPNEICIESDFFSPSAIGTVTHTWPRIYYSLMQIFTVAVAQWLVPATELSVFSGNYLGFTMQIRAARYG